MNEDGSLKGSPHDMGQIERPFLELGICCEFDLPAGAIVQIGGRDHVHVGGGAFRNGGAHPGVGGFPATVFEGVTVDDSPAAAAWPALVEARWRRTERGDVHRRVTLLQVEERSFPPDILEGLKAWLAANPWPPPEPAA